MSTPFLKFFCVFCTTHLAQLAKRLLCIQGLRPLKNLKNFSKKLRFFLLFCRKNALCCRRAHKKILYFYFCSTSFKTLSSSLTQIGLPTCAFMPASTEALLSSSKALAETAITGILASPLFSSARMALVAL